MTCRRLCGAPYSRALSQSRVSSLPPNRIVRIIRGLETRSTIASECGSTPSSTIICNATAVVSSGHPLPQVVDLGSGATFFPFAVARLGWSVIAVDADSRATSSVDRAIGRVSSGGGAVTSLQADARAIALEEESVDCVYCVSVLEHVPEFEGVISEVARILRPAGLFVLTFDVDLRGGCELGPAAYGRLSDALRASFSPVYPEKVVHPVRVLTTDNSIYPMYPSSSTRDRVLEPLRHSLHAAYNRLRGRQLPSGRVLASTYGACLRKLAPAGPS